MVTTILPILTIHYGHYPPWVLPSAMITTILTVHYSHYPPWVLPSGMITTILPILIINYGYHPPWGRILSLVRIKPQSGTCKQSWFWQISRSNKCPVQPNLSWPNQQLKLAVQSFWIKQFPPLINSPSPTFCLMSHLIVQDHQDGFVCMERISHVIRDYIEGESIWVVSFYFFKDFHCRWKLNLV